VAGIATPHPEGIEDQKYDGKTASASFDVEMFGPWPVIKTDGVYAQLEMYAQLRPGSHLDRRRAQRYCVQFSCKWCRGSSARPRV
jgi:hypothetical protein